MGSRNGSKSIARPPVEEDADDENVKVLRSTIKGETTIQLLQQKLEVGVGHSVMISRVNMGGYSSDLEITCTDRRRGTDLFNQLASAEDFEFTQQEA